MKIFKEHFPSEKETGVVDAFFFYDTIIVKETE